MGHLAYNLMVLDFIKQITQSKYTHKNTKNDIIEYEEI